jgi:choline dehydrogenase-like flavoprotein
VEVLETDHLIVGSGAGGALTAARLAEAGRRVLVLEEGAWIEQGEVEPFSLEQMGRQYRSAGLTAALGRPPIAYVEGCCAGGGTEINAGLYHRPPPDLLESWGHRYAIPALRPDDLAPHSDEVERALDVGCLPGPAPRASTVLADGAAQLGWKATEVPRWYSYGVGSAPVKQSMTRTYLPRATRAGADVRTGIRVERLQIRHGRARGALAVAGSGAGGRPLEVRAEQVWVCAGAIGTPALLQRSGLRRAIGSALRVHPTVRLVARFDDPLDAAADVPVHQVKEFGADLTLGGSASRPGYVALALADDWAANRTAAGEWKHMAVYYASIRSEGNGRVVALPRLRDPVVTYRLTARDLALLRSGLTRLAHLLLAAGARTLYPALRGGGQFTNAEEASRLGPALTRSSASLTTVHLTSTVPMGGDACRTPADPFGQVRGVDRLNVNDASLLPEAPGVNPQGTIMAIAARNVEHYLSKVA